MKLVEIADKNKLNDFLSAQPHASFLQSWEWGEFQEKITGKIWRFGVEDNGELIAVATLIKNNFPFNLNYFYCSSGPISKNQEAINFLLAEIKKNSYKEKVIFLRAEPKEIINNSSLVIYRSIDIQPSKTVILELAKVAEELLSVMHQKTRYNIRLAEKKGVEIKIGENNFETFWGLMEKTAARDGFRLHNKNHYEKLLKVEGVKLAIGYFENKPICAGIFSFFGDTATYIHGASSDEYREVMAPYLLHWEMIKYAKANNFKYYDFYGVDEKKWPGVTRFKKGFSINEIQYPGTFDVVFDKTKYTIYKIARKIRRFLP